MYYDDDEMYYEDDEMSCESSSSLSSSWDESVVSKCFFALWGIS